MTQVAGVVPVETSVVVERDFQRESLEQIVRLSMECAAEEQRVEQQHGESLETENAGYQEKAAGTKQKRQRRLADLTDKSAKRQAQIQGGYEKRRKDLEEQSQAQQLASRRAREEAEAALKKAVEQASWQAESAFVAFEMRVDTEEQKAKQELDALTEELSALDAGVREAMTRYRLEMFRVDAPVDEALKKRVAEAPAELVAEHREKSHALVKELDRLTQTSVMDDVVPFVMITATAAVVAAVSWVVIPDGPAKLMRVGEWAVGAIFISIVVWMILRLRKRARVKRRGRELYTSIRESTGIVRFASREAADAAAEEREQRVEEARKKRDQEVAAAREKGHTLLLQGAEQYKQQVAAEILRYKNELAAIEAEKEQGLAELKANRERITGEIEDEEKKARAQADEQHAAALERIESKYDEECFSLTSRWDEGLRRVTELLSAGSGIDSRLVDWNSPAWDQWKSPSEFSGQVRFGEMKVDLAQLTEHVPKRLELPERFNVPALLTLPQRGSLLVEADHAGRGAMTDVAQVVMARLLTQMPAGRAKFTIFDPVGLGQSFAGFMHLADHDESLVGSRIWTEKEHMEQRLADLTEHMETVIQKYLRNEYATIDEYNAQAGELAEPYRFLVIADFPTGFEAESLRRLASIAMTGPKCGVYTIILRDTRQPIPQGARMEEIVGRSVHLLYKNGAFTWDDAVFKRFPLKIDAPPDEKTLTQLMDRVGRAAKEAKRVEVPFASIAPRDNQFWSLSSKNDLRVPIGKSGATRLQALRLGIGVAQHVLVAGKTGSGKSNLMHTIVTNLAMWYGPDEVEFYLVDFKKGVEFKAYASSEIPHARAIAVESDREFGLSVLQRVDGELTRRGAMFRDVGAQEIGAFRDKTGQKLPRTILLIDEFQEFFSEDDKLGQEASGLLDRLVRQGRAFGVHVVLGSQTIGGSSGLARSTLGQIAVRVALQCTEADSHLILGDNNSAARLLTRPGEAIYNDAGGLVEANSPFQIAFLPDAQREKFLEHVRSLANEQHVPAPGTIVFEGNSAADIQKNARLVELLERPAYSEAASIVKGYIGEPVAIKEPSAVLFRRQIGANVLLVGQQEESAVAIFSSMLVSIGAQQKPGEAIFYVMDGTPGDSRYFGVLERVLKTLPHESKLVNLRDVPDAINELAGMLKSRQGHDAQAGPSVYLLVFGLQRYRILRRQEDDFSFSRGGDEPAAPKTDKQFAELLSEGPGVGLHTIMWADTPITLERTLDRGSMRQFDFRVLFQMSAADSSNLIDSPAANRLGAHRALLYSEEQGTVEKCRPYEVPEDSWLDFVSQHLKKRP